MYKDRKACEYVLRIIMDDEELIPLDNYNNNEAR